VLFLFVFLQLNGLPLKRPVPRDFSQRLVRALPGVVPNTFGAYFAGATAPNDASSTFTILVTSCNNMVYAFFRYFFAQNNEIRKSQR
ncbi:MAG TPA: hypothetical protein VN631_06925, partial [Negativicutes bacterium]|nr:hypothetical protein [Negativicutes bacterium]